MPNEGSDYTKKQATSIVGNLTVVKDVVIIFGALGAGLWAVVTQFAHFNEITRVQGFESRRPYLDQQLKTYTRATELAGYLAAQSPNAADWEEKKIIFKGISLGEIPVFASKEINQNTHTVLDLLEKYKVSQLKEVHDPLYDAVQKLAVSIHSDLENIWNPK